MVYALQREQPKLFTRLNKGTVSKWMDSDKSKHQWSQSTLSNVENGHSLTGLGHSGILFQYPQVQDDIVQRLTDLRKSRLPINVIMARSIMLAVIQDHVPGLLKTFKCSEVLVEPFLELKANVYLEICTNIFRECSQLVTTKGHLHCCQAACQCRREM